MFVLREQRDAPRHFQLLLESGGVLRAWALPSLPSADAPERRLAREISPGPRRSPDPRAEGAELWDAGPFRSLRSGADGERLSLERQIEEGHVEIRLAGSKVRGRYVLMRTGGSADDRDWLLIRLDEDSDGRVQKERTSC